MTPPPVPAVTDPAELRRFAADIARVLIEMQAEIEALRNRLKAGGL